LPARIEKYVAFLGLANCAGTTAWEWSVAERPKRTEPWNDRRRRNACNPVMYRFLNPVCQLYCAMDGAIRIIILLFLYLYFSKTLKYIKHLFTTFSNGIADSIYNLFCVLFD
jgi:hypothetical protein